jgi:hypothetical protein
MSADARYLKHQPSAKGSGGPSPGCQDCRAASFCALRAALFLSVSFTVCSTERTMSGRHFAPIRSGNLSLPLYLS